VTSTVCLCLTFISFSLKSCFLAHINSNKVHFKLLLFLNIAALHVCVEDLRSLRPYSSIVRFARRRFVEGAPSNAVVWLAELRLDARANVWIMMK